MSDFKEIRPKNEANMRPIRSQYRTVGRGAGGGSAGLTPPLRGLGMPRPDEHDPSGCGIASKWWSGLSALFTGDCRLAIRERTSLDPHAMQNDGELASDRPLGRASGRSSG
ncbi:MAG: hypothetical protein ACREFD_10255 [Stellaceae bacterium]